MSSPGSPPVTRRKKHRRRTPIYPFVFLALLIAGGVFATRWVMSWRPGSSKATAPSGYVAENSVLRQEYAKYYGTPPDETSVAAPFQEAGKAASKGSFAGAASVLETMLNPTGRNAASSAVPVVYHNLGVSYSALGDYKRAAEAFREVLARESDYAATRKFLLDMKGIPTGAVDPYTRELEPNDQPTTANLISLRAPVGGELAGSNDRADYFKVVAPPPPRDLLSIELENHSIAFAPKIHVYDEKLRVTSWGEKSGRAGESIKLSGGPSANSVLYISIAAEDHAGGQYLLTVKPERAFDKYEPNDDLLTAKRISVGEEISASVMDGGDSDFFSFQSPRRGAVAIEIHNRSNTLIPALSMYNADHRNLGFAQDVRKAGSNIRYMLNAEPDTIYYVQISSQAGTAGGYTLRVD
jgi:hypothetical protein